MLGRLDVEGAGWRATPCVTLEEELHVALLGQEGEDLWGAFVEQLSNKELGERGAGAAVLHQPGGGVGILDGHDVNVRIQDDFARPHFTQPAVLRGTLVGVC